MKESQWFGRCALGITPMLRAEATGVFEQESAESKGRRGINALVFCINTSSQGEGFRGSFLGLPEVPGILPRQGIEGIAAEWEGGSGTGTRDRQPRAWGCR